MIYEKEVEEEDEQGVPSSLSDNQCCGSLSSSLLSF